MSGTDMVITPKQFDINKFTMKKAVNQKTKAVAVYFYYNGGKFFVQTPLMPMPYGVGDASKFASKDGADASAGSKLDINLSLANMDENPKMKQFYDMIKQMEEKIIQFLYENRESLLASKFKGLTDPSQLLTAYSSMIKEPKDSKYPPTIKVKLPIYDGAPSFKLMDMDKNELDFDAVKDNMRGGVGKFIVQFACMYIISSQNAYPTIKLNTGMVQLKRTAAKVDFIEESEDEHESKLLMQQDSDDAASDGSDAPAPKKKAADVVLSDSEPEAASDDDDAPPPPPTKQMSKMTVSKKKPAAPPSDDEDEEEPEPPKKPAAKATSSKKK